MFCLLLFELVFIVQFQYRPDSHDSTNIHFTPPTTFAETFTGPTGLYNSPRDAICFFVFLHTLHIGLPPWYSHFTITLSAHSRAMNIFHSAQKSSLHIYPVQCSKRPILNAFCRILTLLLLCSGDIELNPGPVANNVITTPGALLCRLL